MFIFSLSLYTSLYDYSLCSSFLSIPPFLRPPSISLTHFCLPFHSNFSLHLYCLFSLFLLPHTIFLLCFFSLFPLSHSPLHILSYHYSLFAFSRSLRRTPTRTVSSRGERIFEDGDESVKFKLCCSGHVPDISCPKDNKSAADGPNGPRGPNGPSRPNGLKGLRGPA